ncbi:hypothetical protein BBJ28_00011679 [Nothophytophthora sp. Chile5]|nr:hypothetical protein BBJ28_00011679 [Nothophytophthora sp. Chile5]
MAAVRSHHDNAPSSPVLTIVGFVCRECLPVSGGSLPHVARLLDAFLDEFSDTLTLTRGYLLSGGSLRLLQYLAAHERLTMDPILRRWVFNDVVGCAATKGDLKTLRWLLESYLPDEFLTKAVDEAAYGGRLDVLEWLWSNHRSRGNWGGTELCGAMYDGHVAVVEWLRTHVVLRAESAQKVMEDAVCSGDMVTLQWLIERFELDMNQALDLACGANQWELACWILEHCELEALPEFPYSTQIQRAVGAGNLKFLRLASSLKKWAPKEYVSGYQMIPLAIDSGHLEVVKWLHDDCEINWVGDGFVSAARGGHLEILKYLYEKQVVKSNQQSPMNEAARSGFLDAVQCLHAHSDTTCTTDAMDWAAECGHLDVVQWLHENRREGCTSAAMHLAAANGHMDVVKWLHSHRSEGCQEATLGRAAECGRLAMVQWLHDNRHETFSCRGAMDIAAAQGYLDVVKWLHENRSASCTVKAMNGAAGNGHVEVVEWLHENRNEGCTRSAMDRAAVNGYLEVAQWLHENRHEGCSVEAMDGAAQRGNLEMVKWLHENRTEGCSNKAINNAAIGGHLNVVRWLCRNRSEGCTSKAIKGALRMGWLDVVVFLHSERPECRQFNERYPLQLTRIEVAEWVLEHFPQKFKNCVLQVQPGDWHFGDWARRTSQMLAD